MSTIRRGHERGQVLVIFALSLVVLMMVAALAFDTGSILVERRDQQNAADAASLAGARFLPANTALAISQAEDIASVNGFEDGVNDASVDITIGSWSPGGGFVPGAGTTAIQVQIASERASIFAGIMGQTSWDVGAGAVAVNQQSASGPFAMLSLHPTACPAVRVEGSGTITSSGNIQVNSSCTTGDGAFRVAGTGTLGLLAPGIGCNVVGGTTFGGGLTQNDCDPANTGATEIPDPYGTLGDPSPIPPLPAAMVRWDPLTDAAHVDATPPPAGCPGSATPAAADAPLLCEFGGSYAGQTWRVYAGYYPGGINFSADASFLLEPGIYYIGDGGFRVANAAVTSVDAGGSTLGGGILIFNSDHPDTTTNPGPIVLQGGTAEVKLWPLEGTGDYVAYDNMVIYQDRDVTLDIEIHGGGSDSQVRGIIYAPTAHVLARGNAGTLTLDQVIASTFEARGNGGTINIAYDSNFLPLLQFAGLVQ